MAATENYITQAAADARYQALGGLSAATPAAETPDAAGTAGVSTSASKADHVHPITAAAPVAIGTALTEGVAATFARSDHIHTGPLGTLSGGYAQVTANQAGITTEVDLTGLTVTVTTVSGRRYRITGYVAQFNRVLGTVTFVALNIKEGATQINRIAPALPNTYSGAQVQAVIAPTGGAHTYKLSAFCDGTVDLAAGATSPAFILVEDIGT